MFRCPASIAAFAALALASVTPPAHAQQDTLRVRINADIRSTDPGVNRDGNTDTVMMHLFEGLVGFREDTSVGPMLADKIEAAPDGLSYRFTLRDGVTFHNGAPLTAEDVAFAWKRYLDPETKWRCQPDFTGKGVAKIAAIETPDPRTVVFRLEKPTALFLTYMARTDCAAAGIYHRSSLGADGKWSQPVATGPFKLGEWRRGQFVELARNDGYRPRTGDRDGHVGGKAPLVPKVRFVVIPDSSAAKAALLSGSIDLVADVSVNDMAELKARPEIALERAATMDLQVFLLQTRDPLLKDVRVRRALALALDLPEIVNAVTEGQSTASRSPIPPASPFRSAAMARVPARDVAQAKRLLAEAGYRGEPIKMLTNKRYDALFNMAVLAQAMAQEAGFKIDLEVLDWATQLDRYLKGDYQMMSFSYSARLDAALSFDMFSGPKDTQPRKVWDDPEAQNLLNEAMVISDRARRQAIFEDLHARLLDAVPLIALYSSTDVSAVRRGVQGYRGWAIGQPRLWGVSLRP
jgi:peptide/nickel transport system substrate-binding protein